MYTICVRDRVMIAHSFRGDFFGPAQKLHGATYVVDMELRRRVLDAHGVVADIGRAGAVLRGILQEIEYRNLDEEERFRGINTTTEYLARWIFDRIAQSIVAGGLGCDAVEIHSIKITLHESHVAWAAYEGELAAAIT
jgi:6-pyruvoyl-tetrahydropterin synthase